MGNLMEPQKESTSQSLFERSLKIAPGGVHSPVRAFKSVGGNPIFFESAKGAYLTSCDGNSYIDFCQSFGPNILGHRDPDVQAALLEVVDRAWSFGTCEPYSLELAEWMVERVEGLEKVRFVCSGTEAVMSALRLSRAATKRQKCLKFEGCYHGHVDSMLVKAGSGLAGESASDSAGVFAETAKNTLVLPLNDEQALEDLFKKQGDEIASVIIEPMPANFGLLIQRPEFLRRIRELCDKHGSLLIFDEVISGFRVAQGGMSERLGIRPDLVTYGKVIGGGLPVGCYGGRADLLDQVAPNGPVYQAGTLSASPLGMVAGLASLKKIERLGIYDVLERRTSEFVDSLNSDFASADIAFQVDHLGSIFWVHPKTNEPPRSLDQIPKGHAQTFQKIFHAALKRGLFLAPSGFEVSFLSWAHEPEILNESRQIIFESVKEAVSESSAL